MDALWGIADQVLTEDEVRSLSGGESFLIASAFYLHDLGMAYASTKEGLDTIQRSSAFEAAFQQLTRGRQLPEDTARVYATRIASRELHAQKAYDLATCIIPGTGRYLIENSEFRFCWGHLLGQIAASHHWSITEIHKELGNRNLIPSAEGSIDLAYVACVLRLVDYAHINRERAPVLDRAFRSEINSDSFVHWDAQSQITGPSRQENMLVYSCTAPISDIDAWWLFFDMASGLDREIRSVREYLTGRRISAERLSLQGVKGIESASRFAELVQLAGDTVPIDIRVQPNSMERVVDLLGGKHLYGSDKLAPLRELIQNARDAIALRLAMESAENIPSQPGRIWISLDKADGYDILAVRDNGVGMKKDVVARHLIGVASDYWHSIDYYRDYGKVSGTGFEPIGKFGIGFLSVFMLGDFVEVETESLASPRVKLVLRGIGRRGNLSESQITGQIGTTVRVRLKPEASLLLQELPAVVRSRAPMLAIPLEIRQTIGTAPKTDTIEPGWWKEIDCVQLQSFARSWQNMAFRGSEARRDDNPARGDRFSLTGRDKFTIMGWPGENPEFISEEGRIISTGDARSAGVVRCSKGIAVDVAHYSDMAGILEVGTVELTAARTSTSLHLDADRSLIFRAPLAKTDPTLLEKMQPCIIDKLNNLQQFGMMPARFEFLRYIASHYGISTLGDSSLTWIPVVEPPGNRIYRSRVELLKNLQAHTRIFIGSGLYEGSAYSLAANTTNSSEAGRMLLIPLRHEEISVSYSENERLKLTHGDAIIGNFEEIVKAVSDRGNQLQMLPFLISVVAAAWKMTEAQLKHQKWHFEIDKNMFWSVLDRSTPSLH